MTTIIDKLCENLQSNKQ
jgi:dynein heavy chain